MSRKFAPISEEELIDKIEERQKQHPHDSDFVKSFGSDIKVKFDLENFTDSDFGPRSLLGYKSLKSGLKFCGFCAGGDWEFPVFFIVYWDGSKLRAYVPTDGNPWNTSTKEAYGNDPEADYKNAIKRYDHLKEHFKQLKKEAKEDGEEFEEIIESDEFSYDENEIIADITSRIVVA